MNRKEFAKKWGHERTMNTMGNPVTVPKYDEILADLDEVIKSELPSAEGAEEILVSLIESLGEPDNSIHDHSYEIRPLTVDGRREWWMFHNGVGSGEPLAQWLNKFALLNREKNLREERRFTDWCINHVEIESREEKYIIDNETTIYSFEDLKDYWDKYLKSRKT